MSSAIVFFFFLAFSMLPDWPEGFRVISRQRVHSIRYPKRSKLAMAVWKADQLNMIVTVPPAFWSRLGRKWQKIVFAARMPRIGVFDEVKDFFFAQLRSWRSIKDVQQDIATIYHHNLTIRRMKWWIIRRKYGREPGRPRSIYYWSIQW